MKIIFVGSSSEALPYAQSVAEALSTPSIQVKLWDRYFKPGFAPLEAIEAVANECSGAIFLATPDDVGVVRGRQVKTPRANILLELGVLSGRFGRPSIALCRFQDVELPTDLSGFTYISMGAFQPVKNPTQVELPVPALGRLREWADDLQDTTMGIARSVTAHGYSGRWGLHLIFERWRTLDVKPPACVVVNGHMNLFIPNSGQRGEGVAHGEMSVQLVDSTSARPEFTATIRVTDLILDVHCFPDASMRFVSETYVRNVMEQSGTPWIPTALSPIFYAANTFNWLLRPVDGTGKQLSGTYATDDGRSRANVTAMKL